jgi:hypothetical protein
MKNILKKVLISVSFIILFVCCTTVKFVNDTDYTLGTSMKMAYVIDNGREYQIDSIIMADTLPNIKKWMHMNYTDYETNKRVLKRMYVRVYDNNTESVYIIIGNSEPYKITKRITYK